MKQRIIGKSEAELGMAIPEYREKRIQAAKMLEMSIGYRTSTVFHTDGSVERREAISYDEYAKDGNTIKI